MKPPEKLCTQRGQHGFTLIETLIAAGLMVLLLLPAIQAMRDVTHNGSEAYLEKEQQFLLRNKMNEVLALDFDTLMAAAGDPQVSNAHSDPADTPSRRLVFISRYDGDFSGMSGDPFDINAVDDNLLWVRVAMAHSGLDLTTLRVR